MTRNGGKKGTRKGAKAGGWDDKVTCRGDPVERLEPADDMDFWLEELTRVSWEELWPRLPQELVDATLVLAGHRMSERLNFPTPEDPEAMMRQLGFELATVDAFVGPYTEWTLQQHELRHGRPRGSVATKPLHSGALAVTYSVRDFVVANPGAVAPQTKGRFSWSPGFKAHVLSLLGPDGPGAGMTLAQASDATGVPISTLVSWGVSKLSVKPAKPPE